MLHHFDATQVRQVLVCYNQVNLLLLLSLASLCQALTQESVHVVDTVLAALQTGDISSEVDHLQDQLYGLQRDVIIFHDYDVDVFWRNELGFIYL